MQFVRKVVVALMLAISVSVFTLSGIARADAAPAPTAPTQHEVRFPFAKGCYAQAIYSNVSSSTNIAAMNFFAGDNIALHVNPRPQPLGDVLVLNSFINGAWGTEERPGGYPLDLNKEISVLVWADTDSFVIKAQKEGIPTTLNYKYADRVPLSAVDRVVFSLPNLKSWLVECRLAAIQSPSQPAPQPAAPQPAAPQPAAPQPAPIKKPVVTIYRDGNFAGPSQELTEGSYDMASLTIGNDMLSSLQVPSGIKVTLYEHAGFQGRTKTFTQDTGWVGDDFNDITSSIKVEKVS